MKTSGLLLLAVLLAGCTSKPGAPDHALLGPSVESRLLVPPGVVAIWDPNQLGHVSLVSPQSTVATFIVWKVLPSGEQLNVSQKGYHVVPGRTEMTVGLTEECGVTYQRDLFIGILPTPGANPFTFSDLRNVPFLAPGQLWIEPACSVIPPPPPPPPVCTDPKASNLGKPLPCTYPPPPCKYGTKTIVGCH